MFELKRLYTPAMWSHLQLSVVWVGIQLMVSLVAVTTSTSTCNVAMVRFRQPRTSSGGEVMCLVSPAPNETVTKSNKNECSRECAGRGDVCAVGFNYKHQEELCELFTGSQATNFLQVQDGCEHYMVCIQSNYTVTLRHFPTMDDS